MVEYNGVLFNEEDHFKG